MTTRSSSLTVSLWRDYKDETRRLPGMYVGTVAVTGDAARKTEEFFRSGVRRADLMTVVDVSQEADPAHVVGALGLVRELTAWGIVVEWRLRLDTALAPWAMFSHLYPPREIEGTAEDVRTEWAGDFFPGKCLERGGPGFLEIRDHRHGFLSRIVLDQPDHLEAAARLAYDPAADGLADQALRDFAMESLLLEVGGLRWWAPCRTLRWPHPPFCV